MEVAHSQQEDVLLEPVNEKKYAILPVEPKPNHKLWEFNGATGSIKPVALNVHKVTRETVSVPFFKGATPVKGIKVEKIYSYEPNEGCMYSLGLTKESATDRLKKSLNLK